MNEEQLMRDFAHRLWLREKQVLLKCWKRYCENEQAFKHKSGDQLIAWLEGFLACGRTELPPTWYSEVIEEMAQVRDALTKDTSDP